ncbi:NAD(P)-binding protein [Streptomyces sp. NPDC001500]
MTGWSQGGRHAQGVIGAGSSGMAAGQVLADRGIPCDCFEPGSEAGGNGRCLNDDGHSSAYRSLHIDTSRQIMEYAWFPTPDEHPSIRACRDSPPPRVAASDRPEAGAPGARAPQGREAAAHEVGGDLIRGGGPRGMEGGRSFCPGKGHPCLHMRPPPRSRCGTTPVRPPCAAIHAASSSNAPARSSPTPWAL